ncbi:MAG: hypothetical protein GY936_03130 [Ignavibacteriae bacterium]|nr:hypothetical protein [Ignavibacteriota bacterium]
MKRFSDLVLSGHVHEPNNSVQKDGTEETIFINAGAAYEKRNSQNGFNILEINTDSYSGKVIFYKYLPDNHNWIQNKDINHATDGIFNFELKKENQNSIQRNTFNKSKTKKTEKYVVIFDTTFDELNRGKVTAIFEHLKLYTNDTNISITKMETGSVKIYFETSKSILQVTKEKFNKIAGIQVIKISKLDNDQTINKTEKNDKSVYHWKTFLTSAFSQNIDNPGATFTHRRVDELTLSDLYVAPNLKKIEFVEKYKNKFDKILNSNTILNKKHNTPIKVVVYGEDSSGKTTLLRWWYDKYYEAGYIPILIVGNDIKDIRIDKFNKFVNNKFLTQYTGILNGGIENYEKDRIILIIDDLQKLRFNNSKYKLNLITNINKEYNNILIAGSDLMLYEANSSKYGYTRKIFENFDKYQIIEFGPKLRYKLIEKWCSLGSEQLEKNELIRIIKETESHTEQIIGKNYIPSFPIYLLTILQAKESSYEHQPEYSMHGFYYELLINDSLNNAVNNSDEISLYYNFITEYAYALFDKKIRLEPLSIENFIGFNNKYCEDYGVLIDHKIVLDTLINSKLIKLDDNKVSISYKYIYYFFVARYLSINISNHEIKNIIKSLCQRLHRDEYSSIIIFLTHLSKDQFIIKELLINSKKIFEGYAPIRMDEDVSFINEMVKTLPEQVYKSISIEEAKEEDLKYEEELAIQEQEFDANYSLYEYDLNEDVTALDLISRLTRAVKTIEILGQVTKKYWGEIKAPEKYALAEETYMLGLRTLGFYFGLVKGGSEGLVKYLKFINRKQSFNKNMSKEEIDNASRAYLFDLCVSSSFGITKRISSAIGYEKLSKTFDKILNTHNYTSVKLIDTSIKLDHTEEFPWAELKLIKRDTDSHFLARIVLQNLVVTYLRVFHTSVEDKQKICSSLDIKMDDQRLIDIKSTVKKTTIKR